MENKKVNTKRIIKIIFNIAFWLIIGVLFITWITDFIMVKNEKDAKFCITQKTHTCNGGEIKQCNGIGYKVLKYSCDYKKAIEFGPFFMKLDKE